MEACKLATSLMFLFQLKMVETLIDAGAKVDFKNYDGRTPLSLAAGVERKDSLKRP